MKKIVIGIVILLAITSGFYFYNQPKADTVHGNRTTGAPTVYQQAPPDVTREQLLSATNTERVKAGQAPLALDDRLNTSAQLKAEDMDKNDYFGHANPTTGKRGYEYAHEAYPSCRQTGENLIDDIYHEDVGGVVSNWMTSTTGHREQLLNARDVSVGFGISGTKIVAHYCMK